MSLARPGTIEQVIPAFSMLLDQFENLDLSALASPVVSKSSAYTLTDNDSIVLVNAGIGPVTITLPTSVGRKGRIYQVKKTDVTTNAVTIDANAAETIDGALTQVLDRQFSNLTFASDGANWVIL